VLASFRPTLRQAAGRGLLHGLGAGLIVLVTVFALSDERCVFLMAVAGPMVIGAMFGLMLYRRSGVDVDEHGVHERERSHAWPQIVDLRVERRGGRTHVAAYLADGARASLRAPYDGRLLARDPGFEHKYLTLREHWEAHRRWNLHG
jgi:hypothetical protein